MTIDLTREEIFEAVEAYWVRRKLGVRGRVKSGRVIVERFPEDDHFEFEVETEKQNEEK